MKTVKPSEQWILEAERALPLDPKLTKEIIFSIQQDAFNCGTQYADSKWMNGHYHCRKCGGEMECWKAFHFGHFGPLPLGVSRIGGCSRCGVILVESERNAPKVLEIA